jgi:hypothetical protein
MNENFDESESEPTQIMNYSPVPGGARLEMLVGKLSDILLPAFELIAELKLRSNASAITKGALDSHNAYLNLIWQELAACKEEVTALRKAFKAGEFEAPLDPNLDYQAALIQFVLAAKRHEIAPEKASVSETDFTGPSAPA